MATNRANSKQGLLFEEDYLLRTLGPLGYRADIALTELVANAWDAGAARVEITIPDAVEGLLVIQDNGTGMTSAQFHARWMKLGYNRVKHQGKSVVFPPGHTGKRIAYGRNGIGRHGLLCFADEYEVETTANGETSCFLISAGSETNPFTIKREQKLKGTGSGTRLAVRVERHLPEPEDMLDVISARFLHDPQFEVRINGKSVPLEEHRGFIGKRDLRFGEGLQAEALFFDSTKTARRTAYQGVAFWVGGRLVGAPSWTVGQETLIDRRTHFAKTYTAVVKCDVFADMDLVTADWTGFKEDPAVESLYIVVSDFINDMFRTIAQSSIAETKQTIQNDHADDFRALSALGRHEVAEFIEEVAVNAPTARPEFLNAAVAAIIKLEKTRSGVELLQRLSKMPEDDIEGLNRLLEQWTVRDALCVLDEIDRRISVIEAIRKLSDDDTVDELKGLHPLVTQARWVFGAEFDSAEYSFNLSLRNTVRTVFKVDPGSHPFENPRRRPDLLALGRDVSSSISLTATEVYDADQKLYVTGNVLLVEVKRGKAPIGREEMNQADGYVQDILNCGHLTGAVYIHAFVVGYRRDPKAANVKKVFENPERGRIQAVTYAELVQTAEQRMFPLRETLSQRYEEMTGEHLLRRTLQPDLPKQSMPDAEAPAGPGEITEADPVLQIVATDCSCVPSAG